MRNYSCKEVTDEIIREIVRAGIYAPTAVNKQPWQFVGVKNRQLIEEYDKRAKKLSLLHTGHRKPGPGQIYIIFIKTTTRVLEGAPAFILVFASPYIINDHDCVLAAENMTLVAQS